MCGPIANAGQNKGVEQERDLGTSQNVATQILHWWGLR